MVALLLESHQWNFTGGGMYPRVRHLAQPGADARISGVTVDREPFGAELARQRHVKTRTQIADKALDLALGLGPIGTAKPWHESEVPGEVEERGIVTMAPWSVAVALANHRPHVVVEHFVGNSAEVVEGTLVAAEQCRQPFIGDEFDIRRPAPTEGRDEHREPVASAPDDGEVYLHLAAGLGLKPDKRLGPDYRPQQPKMFLEDADPAPIAEGSQFAQQHRRRNPFRRGSLNSLDNVLLIRFELARPRLPPVARQPLAPQIAPHRVARHIQHPRDRPNAPALPSQDPDLHRFLRYQHKVSPLGVPHVAVGQFSTGDPGSVLHRR